MLTRIAAALEPLMLSPAPRFPPRLRDIGKWWLYRRAMKQLGSQMARRRPSSFTAPATRILHRYFESEPLLATIATDAIIGAMAAPSTPGSAYVLLHHVMGEAGGKRGIWAYIRGGDRRSGRRLGEGLPCRRRRDPPQCRGGPHQRRRALRPAASRWPTGPRSPPR